VCAPIPAQLVLAGFAALPAKLLDDDRDRVLGVEPDLARVDDQKALHRPSESSHALMTFTGESDITPTMRGP
jgi:hypothetical protein